jgi:protein involved in polysaccharide export with SLBB domain
MRHAIAAASLLLATAASAREPSKKFQGWNHGYFEQYAAADVPADAAAHVLVIGYIKKPGVIAPREDLTLTKALEECGGFTDWADHHHIGVWKNAEGRFIIINAYAVGRKATPDPILERGDMVIVTVRWMLGF